jgi:hypothetical protein
VLELKITTKPKNVVDGELEAGDCCEDRVDAKGCYIRVEGYRQVKNEFLR